MGKASIVVSHALDPKNVKCVSSPIVTNPKTNDNQEQIIVATNKFPTKCVLWSDGCLLKGSYINVNQINPNINPVFGLITNGFPPLIKKKPSIELNAPIAAWKVSLMLYAIINLLVKF